MGTGMIALEANCLSCNLLPVSHRLLARTRRFLRLIQLFWDETVHNEVLHATLVFITPIPAPTPNPNPDCSPNPDYHNS